MAKHLKKEKEAFSLKHVGVKNGEDLKPIEIDRDSPVLLIGDSYTLVFHDPALFTKGAGLPDHLALHLGIPVDLVAVMGSAATATRIDLYRRKDELKGKKLVIWVSSMREFTESVSGWRLVPIIK